MKSMTIKGFLTVALIALASFFPIKGSAYSPDEPERFRSQRQEMRTNLEIIWKQNQKIDFWKAQLKEDRVTGSTRADRVFAKNQIAAAKAEIEVAEDNVCRLSKAIDQAYDDLLEDRKMALKQSESELRLAKADMNDGRTYGGTSQEATMRKVAALERETYVNAVAVEEVEAEMEEDMEELRHEIRKWQN